MDDRLDRLERLAALHREGALTDDEFREEKLRVLGAGRAEEPATVPFPLSWAEPVPMAPSLANEAGHDPDFGEREAFEPVERRGGIPWLLVAVAVLAVLGAAALFATSAFRDTSPVSASTVGERVVTNPADDAILNATAPEPVVEEPRTVDVGSALAFRDAGDCLWGAQADRAFRATLSRDGDGYATDGSVRIGDLTLKPDLRVTTQERPDGEDGTTTYYSSARVPEGTLWNELKLSRIVRSHLSQPGTDDIDERALTFLETPERVQGALRRLGVSVPTEGYRELSDAGGQCGGAMSLKAIPGGSALTCQWGC